MVIQKQFNFLQHYWRVALSLKLNEKRTEIMCQTLFTGRIVQNVVKIIILSVFFPSIPPKYVCQLSENSLFLSVFDFLGPRDPHFREIRYSFVGLLFTKF